MAKNLNRGTKTPFKKQDLGRGPKAKNGGSILTSANPVFRNSATVSGGNVTKRVLKVPQPGVKRALPKSCFSCPPYLNFLPLVVDPKVQASPPHNLWLHNESQQVLQTSCARAPNNSTQRPTIHGPTSGAPAQLQNLDPKKSA